MTAETTHDAEPAVTPTILPGIAGAEWRIHAETDGLRVEHITSAGASVDHVLAENVYRSLSEALVDIATVDQEALDSLDDSDDSDD